MLRITIHDIPQTVTFQLEGRLAGPWVQELAACWLATLGQHPGSAVRVDLTAVTFVDAAGKEVLSAMHDRGAELVAAGCLMKAVVAEITGTPLPPCRTVGQQSVATKREKR
jgi:anti-anti-sigma regulatory factor